MRIAAQGAAFTKGMEAIRLATSSDARASSAEASTADGGRGVKCMAFNRTSPWPCGPL